MLYKEAGMFEQSIKFLDENEKYIVDKLTLFENKGSLLTLIIQYYID